MSCVFLFNIFTKILCLKFISWIFHVKAWFHHRFLWMHHCLICMYSDNVFFKLRNNSFFLLLLYLFILSSFAIFSLNVELNIWYWSILMHIIVWILIQTRFDFLFFSFFFQVSILSSAYLHYSSLAWLSFQYFTYLLK